MLAILYASSFALLRLAKRQAVFAILPAWFVLSGVAIGRPENNLGALHLASYFAPVYLLGMVASLHTAALEPWLRRNVVTVVLCAIAAAIASVALPVLGMPAPQLLLKTIICVAVYAALLTLPDRRIPALDLLARYAFAIFFVHGYLVALGRMLATRAAGHLAGNDSGAPRLHRPCPGRIASHQHGNPGRARLPRPGIVLGS